MIARLTTRVARRDWPAVPITTFRIGTPRSPADGLRIGTVRYLPRGVRKEDYASQDYFDVWLPLLAPSRELLSWAKGRGFDARTLPRFFDRYRRQLLADTDAKQTLLLLAAVSERTPLSVGCYCADESRCHRSELLRVLKRAARGKLM